MRPDRQLLRHFLATLAYRTRKALRDAPPGFGDFRPSPGMRTPIELLSHMNGVITYALAGLRETEPRLAPTAGLDAEAARLYQLLSELSATLHRVDHLSREGTLRLLQGPLADTMTHIGQLAMLRRLFGVPVPPENFHAAPISVADLGPVPTDPEPAAAQLTEPSAAQPTEPSAAQPAEPSAAQPTEPSATTLGASFVEQLGGVHDQIRSALVGLPLAAIDWTTDQSPNSIGALTVHIVGSQRYWLGDIANGDTKERERAAEFRSRGLAEPDLRTLLATAERDAAGFVARIRPQDLDAHRWDVDQRRVTVGWILLHVLKHTAYHAGQIRQLRRAWLDAQTVTAGPARPA